ncbi:MAG: hypothetical protein ACRDEA_21365, partial [Microcystaceae cyanobacterium]
SKSTQMIVMAVTGLIGSRFLSGSLIVVSRLENTYYYYPSSSASNRENGKPPKSSRSCTVIVDASEF